MTEVTPRAEHLRRHVTGTKLLLTVLAAGLASTGCAQAQGERAEDPAAERASEPASGPGAAVLVVLNKSDDTAAFVDPKSYEVLGTVDVGRGPHEVAVTPDGRLAYVANYGDQSPNNTISVLDVPGRRVLSTIDLGEFARPHGLCLSHDARRLYVTVEANQAVLEIDTASERIARTFATEQRVSHMCVLTPNEKKLYVANIGSESVSVVDLESGVVSQIEVGEGPEGIDVSPNGREIWVANRSSGDLHVIDTETDEVVARFDVGQFPIRVKFTPGGGHVLVSNAQANEVAAIDARTREIVQRVDVGEVPIGILVEPDGRHAWVAQTQADRVSRLSLSSYEITGHVAPGREPDGLGWARAAHRASGKAKD